MHTPVSNIYNIKSRGIDQLRDLALHYNEISCIDKYIDSITDDRKRAILTSIFIERLDYETVCSRLNIPEVKFKQMKKDAIKELKNVIFIPQIYLQIILSASDISANFAIAFRLLKSAMGLDQMPRHN